MLGKPNVGKSTLVNALLGRKLSIVTRKPQTTRHQILGIHTTAAAQFVFVDTPGWQQRPKRQLNRLMNRQVTAAIDDVDCILMLCDARAWRAEDDMVAAMSSEEGQNLAAALLEDEGNFIDHARSSAFLVREHEL